MKRAVIVFYAENMLYKAEYGIFKVKFELIFFIIFVFYRKNS